jgi:hypothetical protein
MMVLWIHSREIGCHRLASVPSVAKLPQRRQKRCKKKRFSVILLAISHTAVYHGIITRWNRAAAFVAKHPHSIGIISANPQITTPKPSRAVKWIAERFTNVPADALFSTFSNMYSTTHRTCRIRDVAPWQWGRCVQDRLSLVILKEPACYAANGTVQRVQAARSCSTTARIHVNWKRARISTLSLHQMNTACCNKPSIYYCDGFSNEKTVFLSDPSPPVKTPISRRSSTRHQSGAPSIRTCRYRVQSHNTYQVQRLNAKFLPGRAFTHTLVLSNTFKLHVRNNKLVLASQAKKKHLSGELNHDSYDNYSSSEL